MQAYLIGSMRMLERYRPSPFPEPLLHATLLWTKNGVLEKNLGQKAWAVDDSFGGAIAASSWVLKPRQDYGRNGWDMLLPENSIQCCDVQGDHFSIMKTPAVAAKMLGEVSPGIRSIKESWQRDKDGWKLSTKY